jgi:hypothetical protein
VASQAVDPDLWDHDRYDVLTGITWRVLRIAEHLIAHPSQWSEEHGYPAVRSMLEGAIQMTWMLKVEEARPTVWAEFKNYGRGRTKALKLHPEATHARATGAEKKTLEGVLKKLDQEANRDVNEESQDISTAGTFIDDMSLAAMAEEVGMGGMYRSTMGPASSALHGTGRRSTTSTSTAACIRSTARSSCQGLSPQRSPARACHSWPRPSQGG